MIVARVVALFVAGAVAARSLLKKGGFIRNDGSILVGKITRSVGGKCYELRMKQAKGKASRYVWEPQALMQNMR